jgi:hypothetical protein
MNILEVPPAFRTKESVIILQLLLRHYHRFSKNNCVNKLQNFTHILLQKKASEISLIAHTFKLKYAGHSSNAANIMRKENGLLTVHVAPSEILSKILIK